MPSSPPSSFRTHYETLVSSGAIEPDPAQAAAVEAFADLETRLSRGTIRLTGRRRIPR